MLPYWTLLGEWTGQGLPACLLLGAGLHNIFARALNCCAAKDSMDMAHHLAPLPPHPSNPCRQPNSWLQLRLHHTVGQSARSLDVAPLAPAMTARFSFVERAERRSGDTEDGGAHGGQPSPASFKEVQMTKSDSALERSSADGSTSSGSEGLSTARGPVGMPPRRRVVHPHRESGASPYFWSLLRCVPGVGCTLLCPSSSS